VLGSEDILAQSLSLPRNDGAGKEPNGESTMASGIAAEIPVNGSLRNASVDRLTCLVRHWTWADEALARFEQELAGGWEYDEDPVADHPFGAYYHWCALLCGFSDAALEQGDPSIGDIAYYAPWGNLAIFYKDFRYSRGLVSLGRVDGAVDLLSGSGSLRVTFELAQRSE
jgi:Cyclophilin-like family